MKNFFVLALILVSFGAIFAIACTPGETQKPPHTANLENEIREWLNQHPLFDLGTILGDDNQEIQSPEQDRSLEAVQPKLKPMQKPQPKLERKVLPRRSCREKKQQN